MKAIILAAGMGTRLEKFAKNAPKAMLPFLGKPLIQRQVETLKAAHITDIVVIGGYMAEKIKTPKIRVLVNEEYESTNMVATLMKGRDEMLSEDEGVLVCYGDIIYEKRLVEALKGFAGDIGVLVDEDYMEYWKARGEHWQEDLESLVCDARGNIAQMGTPKCPLEQAQMRYVGMLRFSPKGVRTFVRCFDEAKSRLWHKEEKWLNSKSFRKAYMTDMLQALINEGKHVKAVKVSRGWMEFDTNRDFELALSWAEDKSIKRFIELEG